MCATMSNKKETLGARSLTWATAQRQSSAIRFAPITKDSGAIFSRPGEALGPTEWVLPQNGIVLT